jgi:hypothetical protein
MKLVFEGSAPDKRPRIVSPSNHDELCDISHHSSTRISTSLAEIQANAAAAIKARAKVLGTNPNLVTLVQAERWNGVLPTTMVPGSAVPFVSVK